LFPESRMMGTYGGLDLYHPTCTAIRSEEYNISFLLPLGSAILALSKLLLFLCHDYSFSYVHSFALQPPIHITRLSFRRVAVTWTSILPSDSHCMFRSRRSNSHDIITVSCHRPVIATARLLTRLNFRLVLHSMRFLPSSFYFRQLWCWSTSQLVISHWTRHKSLPCCLACRPVIIIKNRSRSKKESPRKCSLKCDVTAFWRFKIQFLQARTMFLIHSLSGVFHR